MKERREGTESIAALRELQRQEMSRIEMLAQVKGLRLLSDKFPGVWVLLENEETGKIPSRFFTPRYKEDDNEVLFEEHSISFPIEDPTQLLTSLKGLSVLYEAKESLVVYDRNDPSRFIEFVGGLIEPKQPKA